MEGKSDGIRDARPSVRSSTVLNGTQTFSVGRGKNPVGYRTEAAVTQQPSYYRCTRAFCEKIPPRRRWPAVARGCKTITRGRCDALQLVKQLYGKKIAVNAATNFNTSLHKTEIGPTFFLFQLHHLRLFIFDESADLSRIRSNFKTRILKSRVPRQYFF